MKFKCNEISTNDEELGCQLILSENAGNLDFNCKNGIIEYFGNYLLLQRFYPEGDFDNDFSYMETNDENLIGEIRNFEIVLTRNYFELKTQLGNIEISINPTEKEFSDLKRILPVIINGNGKLIINE